jgi:hypothetical protein
MRSKLHYLMQNKKGPLHESIVKVPQGANGNVENKSPTEAGASQCIGLQGRLGG